MRRIRVVGVALLALAGAGCTSVKVAQRDGCWVRRTEKAFGRVYEEVGPCDRAEPRWAQDRYTRLVQECMAQADWRWHARALEVWSRGLPYPTPQPREDELLRACMDETRSGLKQELDAANLSGKIGDLNGRIAELSGERDVLRGDAAREHARLQDREDKLAEWMGKSQEKLSDWLGQAAQKPPGNATASATSSSTSDGQATTSNDSGTTLSADSGSSAPPAATPVSSASVVLPPGLGAGAPPWQALPSAAAPGLAPGTAPAANGSPAVTTPTPQVAAESSAPPRQPAARVLPKRTKRSRRGAPVVRPAAVTCPPPGSTGAPCPATGADPGPDRAASCGPAAAQAAPCPSSADARPEAETTPPAAPTGSR